MPRRTLTKGGQSAVCLTITDRNVFSEPTQSPLYTVLFIKKGTGSFRADFGKFEVKGPMLLFATPLQTIHLKGDFEKFSVIQFHGDYYCIEYHKKEVACNGIIFNDIYTDPVVELDPASLAFFSHIIDELDKELSVTSPADTVIVSFIQLFLAKAATIKVKLRGGNLPRRKRDAKMEAFRELINENFRTLRRPAAYAKLLNISPNTLTKRCRVYYMKTPSDLIHERVILEAKKGLHLTRKTVKEVAHSLKFEDEHYFSRFFKKITRLSPQAFRAKTGISIVADLSMPNRE